MEINLTETWLRKDPVRWTAGAISGFAAGLVAIMVSMVVSRASGGDPWIMLKLFASVFVGPEALRLGVGAPILGVGFVAYQVLSVILGVAFSHFVFTNRVLPVLAMGFTWGFFQWVFWANLYLQSFRTFVASDISSGPRLLICMSFGLSLIVLVWIDPILRGKRGRP
jgi:hypothetical protein